MLRIKTHTYINTQKNCFSLSPSKYRRIRNYSIFSVNGFPSMSNSIEHFKIIWKTNNKKRNNFQTKNQKKNHKTAKNTSKKFKNKMNTKKCVNDLKISNKKRKLKSREKNYEKTDWALFNLTTIQYEFIFRNPWNFRTNSDRFHFHLIGFAFDWNCHYLSLVMQYFFLDTLYALYRAAHGSAYFISNPRVHWITITIIFNLHIIIVPFFFLVPTNFVRPFSLICNTNSVYDNLWLIYGQ